MENIDNKVKLGFYGQEKAEKFLREKGMSLLKANFRATSGEIDLIMRDGEYIVFIEVKYRKSLKYGLPREAVGRRKQQTVKRTALHYIARHGLKEQDFRFDVLEILDVPEGLIINHIENAFQ